MGAIFPVALLLVEIFLRNIDSLQERSAGAEALAIAYFVEYPSSSISSLPPVGKPSPQRPDDHAHVRTTKLVFSFGGRYV